MDGQRLGSLPPAVVATLDDPFPVTTEVIAQYERDGHLYFIYTQHGQGLFTLSWKRNAASPSPSAKGYQLG